MLVEYVHGDFLNVVGFPLNHFCKKLAELYYPPSKHNVQHKKYDSIPSVDTFENLSDGESSNFTEHKVASKLDHSGMHSSGTAYTSENTSAVRTGFTVPLENQNGVSQSASKLPSKILELMDGFRASKVREKIKQLITCCLIHCFTGLQYVTGIVKYFSWGRNVLIISKKGPLTSGES